MTLMITIGTNCGNSVRSTTATISPISHSNQYDPQCMEEVSLCDANDADVAVSSCVEADDGCVVLEDVGSGFVGSGVVGPGFVGSGVVGPGFVGPGFVGSGVVGPGVGAGVTVPPPPPRSVKEHCTFFDHSPRSSSRYARTRH